MVSLTIQKEGTGMGGGGGGGKQSERGHPHYPTQLLEGVQPS